MAFVLAAYPLLSAGVGSAVLALGAYFSMKPAAAAQSLPASETKDKEAEKGVDPTIYERTENADEWNDSASSSGGNETTKPAKPDATAIAITPCQPVKVHKEFKCSEHYTFDHKCSKCLEIFKAQLIAQFQCHGPLSKKESVKKTKAEIRAEFLASNERRRSDAAFIEKQSKIADVICAKLNSYLVQERSRKAEEQEQEQEKDEKPHEVRINIDLFDFFSTPADALEDICVFGFKDEFKPEPAVEEDIADIAVDKICDAENDISVKYNPMFNPSFDPFSTSNFDA